MCGNADFRCTRTRQTYVVSMDLYKLFAVVQVLTEASTLHEAWSKLLNRPFKGLEKPSYRDRFETDIADPYLKEQALRSLTNAGNDQQLKYDFSSEKWMTTSQHGTKIDGKFKSKSSATMQRS